MIYYARPIGTPRSRREDSNTTDNNINERRNRHDRVLLFALATPQVAGIVPLYLLVTMFVLAQFFLLTSIIFIQQEWGISYKCVVGVSSQGSLSPWPLSFISGCRQPFTTE